MSLSITSTKNFLGDMKQSYSDDCDNDVDDDVPEEVLKRGAYKLKKQ